jgi:hypothetical protein
MKDVQATGTAPSPQRRTSSTSKQTHFPTFFFRVIFAHDPDPHYQCGSGSQPTNINADPDKKHYSEKKNRLWLRL